MNFGIIGFGVIGGIHSRIIHEMLPGARLIAVSDICDPPRIKADNEFHCAVYSDYRDMLKRPDIDAVSVCVPSGMHARMAVDAARAGKHVVVEKPIEISVEAGRMIIDACREIGVVMTSIMQHRFDPASIALKDAIGRGCLGRTLMGYSRTHWYRGQEYYDMGGWRGTYSMDGGGAIINQSIHAIDQLIYFMGPVESVFGVCATLAHDIETEDAGVATLRFKSGAIGTIEGGTIMYPGLHTEIGVYGDMGSAVIKDDRLSFYALRRGEDAALEETLRKPLDEARRGGSNLGLDPTAHVAQYKDFIEAIEQGRSPTITGEDALDTLAVIRAMYISSRTRRETPVTRS